MTSRSRLHSTGLGPRYALRRSVSALLAVPCVLAATVAGTVPAQAAAHYGTVEATTQQMTGPYLPPNFSQTGSYRVGTRLNLTCYVWGQKVSGWGGTSNLWYQVSDGHYAADVDLLTGSNGPITGACPTISLNSWVSQTRGKIWANASGDYPGECVSLVSQYLLRVKGIKTGAWGNAVDYRSGGSGGNKLKALGFTWSTNQSFKDGDILVWGQSSTGQTGPAGHIGIWYGGKVYDQNDGRHSPARTANSSSFFTGGYLGHWTR